MQQITQQDLRAACADLHTLAEKTRLAQELFGGTIDPVVYKNYCYQLYLIADAIESRFDLPDHLVRKNLLVQDIAEGPPCAVRACPSTIEYINNIGPNLRGHIYTHYLGWLYGGQMIAKKIGDLPKNHLKFDQPKISVDYVRTSILGLILEGDADEAKRAFEYTIRIYDELYELH